MILNKIKVIPCSTNVLYSLGIRVDFADIFSIYQLSIINYQVDYCMTITIIMTIITITNY